jgi:hypothetical protein
MLLRWTKFLMYPWRCSSRLVHWCSYHPNYKLCMSYHIIFVFDIGNLKSVAGFAMYQEIIIYWLNMLTICSTILLQFTMLYDNMCYCVLLGRIANYDNLTYWISNWFLERPKEPVPFAVIPCIMHDAIHSSCDLFVVNGAGWEPDI